MESKDMLPDQVCNSDTPSSKLLVDSQLLGLWFASRNPGSRVSQKDGLKTLDGPVQDSKQSQFPSNFTLFGAWLFLFITVAAMLAPLSNFWGPDPSSPEMGPEESSFILPE
ncbi:hypothetical protein [Oscillatoria sp. HE19RPO]|uniref:hypothetical protein n=1 Tax=Oscillatoria sp. HE19RPO TaxID=2954806 RepID=UPI0020C3E289|nr:hypothetical protein [Oscillatoria sp. HE19RPO]